MKCSILGVLLLGMCFPACTPAGLESDPSSPESRSITLQISNELDLDTSLLLFFRRLPDGRDSFVLQRKVDRLTEENNRSVSTVPAGFYRVVLLGNVREKYVVIPASGLYKECSIEYKNGEEPPDVYFGWNYANVGENKIIGMGLIHLNARINLTVKDIPEGVNQIDIDLRNTTIGVWFDLNVIQETVEPFISKTLYDVTPGTSPTVVISSFPALKTSPGGILEVRCYDAEANILYKGESPPITLQGGSENITIACSFQVSSQIQAEKTREEFILTKVQSGKNE